MFQVRPEATKPQIKAAIEKLAADPKVENVEDLFTVNMVVNFLASKLN